MASGHVNRRKKAEHMAAPTTSLRREDFPCQLGAVHTCPIASLGAANDTSAIRGKIGGSARSQRRVWTDCDIGKGPDGAGCRVLK